MSTYAAEIQAILATVRARIEAEEGENFEIVELSDDPTPDIPTAAAPGMAEFYGYGRLLEDIREESHDGVEQQHQQEEGEEEEEEEEEEEYVNRYATNEGIARRLGIPDFGAPNTHPIPAQGLFLINARAPTPPPLDQLEPPAPRQGLFIIMPYGAHPPPLAPLSESESEPEDAAIPEHMQCAICLSRQITLAYSGCTHGACRTCVKRICATQGPQSTFPCHVCRALVVDVGPLVEREGAEGLRWAGWEINLRMVFPGSKAYIVSIHGTNFKYFFLQRQLSQLESIAASIRLPLPEQPQSQGITRNPHPSQHPTNNLEIHSYNSSRPLSSGSSLAGRGIAVLVFSALRVERMWGL
ncbi:hypothetical protein DFP73DRAFT_620489 [Morchella snyderi]|nr:hypothetical protein DFP73DRAFT_620489 [Morchella snyderi]